MANPDGSSGMMATGISCLLRIMLSTGLFHKQVAFGTNAILIICTIIIVVVFVMSIIIVGFKQYNTCKTVDTISILKATIAPVVGSIVALGISSFAICRVPMTSIFASFAETGKSSSVCGVQSTLEDIEQESYKDKNGWIKGLSAAFYLAAAMLITLPMGIKNGTNC